MQRAARRILAGARTFVARANDLDVLNSGRLARLVGREQQVPLDPLTMGRVSRYWWSTRCSRKR